jgi:TrmH family RNA methyltransferase
VEEKEKMEITHLGKTGQMFKKVRSLKKIAGRKEAGLYLVEGRRLVEELLASTSFIEALVFDESLMNSGEMKMFITQGEQQAIPLFSCSSKDFDLLADTMNSQGVVAAVPYKESLKFTGTGNRFVYIERCADPGNLGTIIRSLDFFGFDGLLLGPNSADPYSPKVVRATMGSIFRLPIYTEQKFNHLIKVLPKEIYNYLALIPSEGVSLYSIDASKPVIIVMGPETGGLTSYIEEQCTHKVTIPGNPRVESLNLAVATAVTVAHFNSFSK